MHSYKIYGIWPQVSNQTYTRTSAMQSRWCGARPNKHPAIISTILPANFKNRHRCLISWFYSMLHGAVELILRNFLNLFKLWTSPGFHLTISKNSTLLTAMLCCVNYFSLDSPHLELSLLDQGDKSVVFFAVQGWDTLYRRGVHILSALGSSLQRDR